MGDQLDIYTRNRLKSVLQDHQISYTSSQTAVAGATNIYLGVHGQNSQAEKEVSGISQGLFDKIDAYACQSRTIQSLSSVKIQMLSSTV